MLKEERNFKLALLYSFYYLAVLYYISNIIIKLKEIFNNHCFITIAYLLAFLIVWIGITFFIYFYVSISFKTEK